MEVTSGSHYMYCFSLEPAPNQRKKNVNMGILHSLSILYLIGYVGELSTTTISSCTENSTLCGEPDKSESDTAAQMGVETSNSKPL